MGEAAVLSDRPHAVCVPAPARGHINSLMHLATALATSHGFTITFIYFRQSYEEALRKSLLPDPLHPSIRIQVLPDGLSKDLSLDPSLLAQALPTMHDSVRGFLASPQNPAISCIIADTFVPFAQDVANSFGIPRVDFWTSTATMYLMLLHLPELVSKGFLPLKAPIANWSGEGEALIDFVPGLPPFPITELPHESLVEDLSAPFFQFFLAALAPVREAHTVLIHSLYELERDAFDALRADDIPAYSVGPLLGSNLIPSSNDTVLAGATKPANSGGEEDCLTWLDSRATSSVIYVAFGSLASLSVEDIIELAHGLEQSGQAFLWVIRSDSRTGDLSQILPQGFLDRTKERGLIISWAPQPAVLAHPSVGGFLTHCGWNSTLESLWMGVPLVGCPRMAEQRSNMSRIENEWRIGLRLETKPDGTFTREAVQKAVEELMQGELGKEVRNKAKELSEIARRTVSDGGVSHTNLQKFTESLQSKQQCQKS